MQPTPIGQPNLASCSKVVCTHNWDQPQPLQTYSPHRGIINCVVWNHTNKALASCSIDGKIVLVSPEKPDQAVFEVSFDQQKPVSVNSCAFSSNSRYIAAGGTDSLVKIWDMRSSNKEVPTVLRSHFGSVTSVAWSKLDDVVASSSMIGDIFLNSARNGNVIENFASKSQESINMIRFSQGDTHNRLGACTSSGSVLVWDITARSPMCTFLNAHKSAASALSFSNYNPVLLVSCSLDQNLNFYDINEKKQVKTITAEQSLNSVSFHSDGHTLVAGGMYGGLYVYDLRKPNAPRQKLLGHESTVRYVDFLKDRDPVQTNPVPPSKYTSILPVGKSSVASNSEPPNRKQQISTIPILIDKPQAVVPTISVDKHRSMSKAESTSNPIVQQPTRQPLQPSNTVIKHSLSSNSFEQPSQSSQPSQHVNNFIRQGPEERPVAPSGDTVRLSHLQEMEKRLRNDISQRFDNVHLQIVRQFQIQQKELQMMLLAVMQEKRNLEEQNRQLRAENEKLKKTSY